MKDVFRGHCAALVRYDPDPSFEDFLRRLLYELTSEIRAIKSLELLRP